MKALLSEPLVVSVAMGAGITPVAGHSLPRAPSTSEGKCHGDFDNTLGENEMFISRMTVSSHSHTRYFILLAKTR